MKGYVLDFSVQEAKGVITGDDGKRYPFLASEWKESDVPTSGMLVDFDINEYQHAVGVYLDLKQSSNYIRNNNKLIDNTGKKIRGLFDYALYALLERYADFNGRASRSEFWGYHLFFSFLLAVAVQIIMVMGFLINETFGNIVSLLIGLAQLGLVIPSLSVGARRLHDTGRNAWWLLLLLLPLVGVIVLIVFWAQPGQEGENQYGPSA